MASSVADVIVSILKASGVRRVYGIPGDSLNGFTDALRRDGAISWQHDPATTDRVAAAFAAHFGDHAGDIDRQTVSEDFTNIPDAAGVPYTYWALGFTAEKTYRAAEKAGRLQDLTSNHSPKFLPPLQPTLRTGTEALVAAAQAWLAPDGS
jgi:Thiamine pyrophosphate enzyme, N-terminal TPP binding domain